MMGETTKEYTIENGYDIEDISSNPLVQKLIQSTVGYDEGFIRVNPSGFIYPSVMRRYIDKIKKFEVRDNDIWICSFPKCGTTWTQEMVWCLMNNLDFETSKKIDLDDRMIYFELTAICNDSAGEFYADTIDLAAQQASPRIIKTHLPFTMLPDQIRTRVKTPKLVCVTRNSRDVCVSMYHHSKLLEGFNGGFDLWAEIFCEGYSLYYAPFFQHIESYYSSKYENILFLKYEEMKKDLKQSIIEASSFIQKEFLDENINRLSEHLSFKNFQNTPSLNKVKMEKVAEKIGACCPEKGSSFIRKGQVGDWVNYFTAEMSEKFVKKEDKLFISTGLRL